MTGHDLTWHGMAWHGMAWHGRLNPLRHLQSLADLIKQKQILFTFVDFPVMVGTESCVPGSQSASAKHTRFCRHEHEHDDEGV